LMSRDEELTTVHRNPLLLLLARHRRHIRIHDIGAILSAVASMGDEPFTLKDLDPYIPDSIKSDKKRRRSVSTLLETLAEIGYLSKPSERRWLKRYPSLSQFLSSSLFDLAEVERSRKTQGEDKKVIRLGHKKD